MMPQSLPWSIGAFLAKTATSLAAAAMLLVASAAQAELFALSQGGQVEGKLLNPSQSPRQTYEIEVAGGGKLTLPAALVERVTRQSEAQKRYEELLPKMPPTVDGMWKMAEWCRDNGLDEARRRHLQELLAIEPDHADARAALGHARHQGQWLTQDDIMRQRGYVRYQGTWKLPQEIELTSRKKQLEDKEREWRGNVRRWRSALGSRNAAEAMANLRQIDDPAATAAVLDALKGEKDRSMRILFIETLGRLGTPAAVATLTKLVVDDPDSRVRQQCVDELSRLKPPSVVPALVRMLGDAKNEKVNRAAAALARLGDETAIAPLIDALRTKHRFVIQPGGGAGISPTFTPGGGGGLSVGGKPQVIEKEAQNEAVLQALVVLTGGANFGFDKDAWKQWWAAQRAPRDTNLRRDR